MFKVSDILIPSEVRKILKIVDELDENVDTRRELIQYLGRDKTIEYLKDCISSDEDELDEGIVQLIGELEKKR